MPKYRITSSTGWQTQAEITQNLPNFQGKIDWWVVDFWGNFLEDETGRITFQTDLDAQEFCDRMNLMNDSGIKLLI